VCKIVFVCLCVCVCPAMWTMQGEFRSYLFVVVNMQEEYTYLCIGSIKEIMRTGLLS